MQRHAFARAGAVVAAAFLVTLGGVGGAVAGSLITSADIKDGTVRARDIARGGVTRSELRNGTIGLADLSSWVKRELAEQAKDGADGTDGSDGVDGVDGTDGVAGLEADGARPGVTQLKDFPGNGENSTEVWTAGPAGEFHTSWVVCPDGKTALGGGFSRDDEPTATHHGLHIVSSAPAQIDPAATDDPATATDERVLSMAGAHTAIEGDAAGSFQPNGWVVEGFNNGNTDLVVRPWVVCAAVND